MTMISIAATQNCGVHAADYPPISPNRLSFSYLDAGQPIPCELDVYKLYSNYFGNNGAGSNDPDPEYE